MRTLIRFIQKYHILLLFLILELGAVLLMSSGSHFQRSRIVGLNRQVAGFFYDHFSGGREYLHLRRNNQVLVEENARLREELTHINEALDSSSLVLTLRDELLFSFMPAKVIHNTVYRQYNFITLNKGKEEGVFRDMGVISDEGLVGIVLESSDHFATVIPLINRDFRISARIKSNNYAGILQWEGDDPEEALLKEIPFHVELSIGDTIQTSGFSAIFPEGIPIGRVEEFSIEQGNFYDIRVRLFTRFQSLFHVNVIRNYRQVEQAELEARN